MKKNNNIRGLATFLLAVLTLVFPVIAINMPVTSVVTDVESAVQQKKNMPTYEDSLMVANAAYDPFCTTEIETEMSSESMEEFEERCKLVHVLWGNEPVEVQTAIMATVINVEESEQFDGDFYDIINLVCSLMPTELNLLYSNTTFEEIPNNTVGAVRDALNGADPTELLLYEEATEHNMDLEEYAEGGAIFFCHKVDYEEELLGEIQLKVEIGDYIFYKK